jgi:hypothetical protein
MNSTDVEPDSRLAKLCAYCSSLVSNLDDSLRRIEQGESSVLDQNHHDLRPWVAAAENGCGMCSAFLDGLRSPDGEAISTSGPKFEKALSAKVKWTASRLMLQHPDDVLRDPEDQNKIITFGREIHTDDGFFYSQTLITERESSKHR